MEDAKALANNNVTEYNRTNEEYFTEADEATKRFDGKSKKASDYKYVTVFVGIDGDVQYYQITLSVAKGENGNVVYNIGVIDKIKKEALLSSRFKDQPANGRQDTYASDNQYITNPAVVNPSGENNSKKTQNSISEAATAEENKITIDDVRTLRSIGRKSINDFTSDDITKAEKWARKFYSELKEKSPFFRAWFGDWRAYDKTRIELPTQTSKEYSAGKTTNADTGKVISWGATLSRETKNHAVKEKVSIKALNNINEIVEKSVLFDTAISDDSSKTKMPNTAFMHSFYTVFNNELIKLYAEEALDNSGSEVFTRAYELKDIQKITDIPNGVLAEIGGLTDEMSADISVSDLFDLVKRYDKDFHPKPVNLNCRKYCYIICVFVLISAEKYSIMVEQSK